MNTHTMKDKYGTWSITQLPDSTAVGWSHNVEISTEFRGQGFGQTQHKQRLKFAKSLGLSLLLCSITEFNAPQRHILEKFGWKPLYTDDTTRCYSVWGINLEGSSV